MYCSEFEITFMYVNLELDGKTYFIRILIIYTYVLLNRICFVFFNYINLCKK